MKKMTFEEFDTLEQRLQTMPYQGDDWWPTKSELRGKTNGEINAHIPFLVWLLKTNGKPETKKERESEQYIKRLLYGNLKLYNK